jgi:integrase
MAGTRRRFGSVRKLPSGRWQARYIGPTGHRHTAPATFANKTDASRWLVAEEASVMQGRWLDPDVGGARLEQYALAWINQRTVRGRPLAPRTRETYEHSLAAWIAPHLGEVPVGKLTPELVRTWHSQASASGHETAVRQAYALLRAVLNAAVDDGALSRNPCRIRGAGQPNSPERPLLSLDQVEALAAAISPHLRALVLLAFWAQLRLGELLGLQFGDIDLERGTLRVDRQLIEPDSGPLLAPPKAASQRTVHLPEPAIEAIRTHLVDRPAGMPGAPLFTRRDGSSLRAHHVHGAWRTARSRVGLSSAHIHDLRHAGLTLAAQSGATLAEVMRRAGHSTQRAAMIYQHAAEDRDREVASRLTATARAHRLGT